MGKDNLKIILCFVLLLISLTFFNVSCAEHECTYDNGKVIQESTCTVKGVKQYTCTECGNTKEIEIDLINHSPIKGWKYDDANHFHLCSCGLQMDIDKHSIRTKTITEATCTKEGELLESCSLCDYKKTVKIDMLDHSYDKGKVIKEATIFETGIIEFKCKKCQNVLKEDIPMKDIINDLNKENIYLITTSVGATNSEVGISYHTKYKDSIIKVWVDGSDDIKTYHPIESFWSIEEKLEEDDYCKNRYVCNLNLTDLLPNTKYNYCIYSDVYQSVTKSFTTQMTNSYKIMSFVDFQIDMNNNTTQIIKKFKEMNPDINLLTCTGDLADEGSKEKVHRHIFDNSVFDDMLLAIGVGDHEYWGTSVRPYVMYKEPYSYNRLFNNPKNGEKDSINSSYYFLYNDVLYVYLDCGNSNAGQSDPIYQKQATWLENVLSNKSLNYNYIIVSMHKSLYGASEQDGAVKKIAPLFTKIFDKYKVDLVISGHDHEYSRTYELLDGSIVQSGVTYLDLGNSGSKTRALDQSIKDSTLHAKSIDLKAKGLTLGAIITINDEKIQVSVYDMKYNLMDSFEIKKK